MSALPGKGCPGARTGDHRGCGGGGDRTAARRQDPLRPPGDRRDVRGGRRLRAVLLRLGHRRDEPGGRPAGDQRAPGALPVPGLRGGVRARRPDRAVLVRQRRHRDPGRVRVADHVRGGGLRCARPAVVGTTPRAGSTVPAPTLTMATLTTTRLPAATLTTATLTTIRTGPAGPSCSSRRCWPRM